jgi:hypothetical protein
MVSKSLLSNKFILAVFLAVFLLSGCSDESKEVNVKNQSETFKGEICTGDCSGHKAGYNWAEKKGITNPSDCGGNSNSFIEGCRSYAREQ